MPSTLQAGYAGVLVHIGDAADVMEAAVVALIGAQSVPIKCLRITDP